MVLRDDVELLNSITDSVRERPFRSAVEEMQHKAQQLLSQAQQQRMPRTPSRPASPRRADSRPASPGRGLEGQGSYLGNFLKRNQLLSSPKHGYYSPPFERPPSILTHAKRPGANARNRDTVEEQFGRDTSAFERTARKYREHAEEQCHHHRPQDIATSLWNQGYVGGKGLAKVQWPGNEQQYDPILGSYKQVAKVNGKARPSSAPPSRPSDDRKYTRQLANPGVNQGTHNPLTHTWSRTPDTHLEAQHRKESDRVHGYIGIVAKQDARGVFDPVRGEWRPVSPNRMPAGGERPHTPAAPPSLQASPSPAAAPRAAAEPGDAAQVMDVSGAGPSAASPAAAQKSPSPVPAAAQAQRTSEPPRPASAGRQTVANGETWGSYNPLTHQWLVPPRNNKFKDQEAVTTQQTGLSGQQLKKPQRPATQGIYNPITNAWVVPPSNPRMVEGLSFAPATIFKVDRPQSIATARYSTGCSR